jgi:glyoxylase-like metal-dependent hydrolase (beta-lactamase superfamily II)
MKEILPGIFTWPWFSERHGYDFNGWLIDGVAIDPVEPGERKIEAKSIVLTNRNHVRASAKIREATGARVSIHRDDAAHARAQGAVIDEEIDVGAKIGPFTAVDASGKSPGEIALHFPERRILVVGDACVGSPPGECKLLPEKVIDDLPRLKASLARLCELDFDTLLVGDGAPILQGGRAALRRLL